MISFSGKLILSSNLFPTTCVFDADNRKLVFKNNDFRDTPRITYTLNEDTYTASVNKKINYNLPEVDKYYTLVYTGSPTKKNYKEFTGRVQIYKNNPECKDFIYESKISNTVLGYTGTKNDIVIPNKYNMVETTSAIITSFPNVSGKINLTTGDFLSSFWIKESRIETLTVNCPEFKPMKDQFSGLTNLKNIVFKNSLSECPENTFYNCTNLSMSPASTKDVLSFGNYALYNTPMQKIVHFAGTILESGVCDYPDTEGVQKVIFTSSNSINGLTNKTLVSGSFTDGMLYCGNKKHQIYCDVSNVPDEDAVDLDPIFIHFNPNSNAYFNGKLVPSGTLVLKVYDENIIGFQVKATTSSGNLRGEAYCIPTETTAVNNKVGKDDKYWYIPLRYFYGGTTALTSDIWRLTPIDRNGLTNKTTAITLEGVEVDINLVSEIKD